MKIDADQMRGAAGAAEDLLKAMANRHRLMILCRLAEREHSVGELAEVLDLRDSTVSQHLALLRKDALVATRRQGQTVFYAIASTPARKMVDTLYRVYCVSAPACGPQSRRAGKPEKPSGKGLK